MDTVIFAILMIFGTLCLYIFVLHLKWWCRHRTVYYSHKEYAPSHYQLINKYGCADAQFCDWFFGKQPSYGFLRKGTSDIYILYCQDTTSHMYSKISRLNKLFPKKYNVLIFDYPGYGITVGQCTESGMYLEATSAIKYLITTLNVPADKIVIYGEYLGTAVASELCRDLIDNCGIIPRCLILDSAHTSLENVIFGYCPSFLKFGVNDELSNKKWLLDIRGKLRVKFMHSQEDKKVDMFNSIQLWKMFYQKGKNKVSLLKGPGGALNVPDEQLPLHFECIEEFIDKE